MYGARCCHAALNSSCEYCTNRTRPCNAQPNVEDEKLGNLMKHSLITKDDFKRKRARSVESDASPPPPSDGAASPIPMRPTLVDQCFARAKNVKDPLHVLANATQKDLEAIAFASSGLPYSVCQNHSFRAAYNPTITLAREMAEQTVKTTQQILAAKNSLSRNRPVTLAFDYGTVRRPWFGVMAIVPGDVPYILSIKTADSFPDKKLTADNMEAYLLELTKGIEKDNAWVVAAVAGATNMQKAIFSSMLAIECGVHIIAFLAKDLMKNELLAEAQKIATKIFKAHRKELPYPCGTRWNSLHRLIMAILIKYDARQATACMKLSEATKVEDKPAGRVFELDDDDDAGVYDAERNATDGAKKDVAAEDGCVEEILKQDTIRLPETKGAPEIEDKGAAMVLALSDDNAALLSRAAVLLAPFISATNWLQSDSATVYDMAIVFGLLATPMDSPYDVYAAALIEERKKSILQPAVAFIAYYHPGLRQADAPECLFHYVRFLSDGMASVLRPLRATVNMLMREMDRWEEEGSREPCVKPNGYTLEEYAVFWGCKKMWFPVLSGFLCTLIKIAATEACVEGAFSKIKHTFRSNHQRASDDVIISQFLLKSLTPEPSTHKPKEEEKHRHESNFVRDACKEKRFNCEQALALANFIPVDYVPAVPQRRPTVGCDGECKCCNKLQWAHDAHDRFLRCTTCSGMWMRECLDMRELVYIELKARMETHGDRWTCKNCRLR